MMFGPLSVRPKALAHLIRTEVLPKARRPRDQGEDSSNSRSRRTRAVKTTLRRKGLRMGFRVFPNTDKRLSSPFHEWLYDLIWWDDRPGRKGVALAIECEWSGKKDSVIYDFEKLLAVKSPLKLFVYRKTKRGKGNVKGRIEEYLKGFRQHVAGENYVMCELRHDDKFYCYLFRIKATSHGKIANVRFRTL